MRRARSPRSMRGHLRRVAAAALVLLWPVVAAGPAGADGARPTNFESVIDSIDPDLSGIDVQIVGGDAFVQVTAEPGTEVEIPGYDGEPYLRIDADGTVLRNRRSAATYLNESRSGTVSRLPGTVDASATPEWERIGEGGRVAWHDHRVHWMLDSAPTTSDGVVQDWLVPLTVDGTEVQVSGRLLHHDDQLPWPALVGVAIAAVVAWRARREAQRAGLLAGAAVVALASSLDWYLTNPPGASPGVLPLVLPALALVAAAVAHRTPPVLRHLVLPLAAVALLVGWFVERVGLLWMPTLPTARLPDVLERIVGAGVAGVALGVALAVLVRPYPVGVEPPGTSTARSAGSQSSIPPRS